MNEYPILFNREMMKAYLAGRKTQTRRFPIKQPKPIGETEAWMINGSAFPSLANLINCYPQLHSVPPVSKFGRAGDSIYIRETWRPDDYDPTFTIYQADYTDEMLEETKGIVKWKPSIHMPRHRSRFLIPIQKKRLERIQDITDQDAYWEGVEPSMALRMAAISNHAPGLIHRATFRNLWDSLYEPPFSWNDNPFVEVIEFDQYKIPYTGRKEIHIL